MSTNHLPIEQRVEIGRAKEKIVLDLLNSISFDGGKTRWCWRPATDEEDMHKKIDAWMIMDPPIELSAQIKVREEYPDLGIAVIMPYDDHSFVEGYNNSLSKYVTRWDRDMVSNIDLYVLYTGARIVVVEASRVKSGVGKLLNKLKANGGFGAGITTFNDPHLPGACLKRVKDRGAGYSVGQWKVIAYFEPDLLVNRFGAYEYKIGWQK